MRIFLVCCLCLLGTCSTEVNNRPIIGILAQTTDDPLTKYGDTFVRGSYVSFLQQAGARVVPIRVYEDPKYYINIFKKINGVLFPGGDKNFTTSYMAIASRILYDLAVKANDAGDYFPLWGTCQGFQLLTNLTARQNLLVSTDSENISLPLDLKPGYKKSRLFGQVPQNIISTLTRENVTPNFHHFSVLEKDFQASPSLSSFYRILSTNRDRAGKVFVSTMEAYKYPFYGTQWHPEALNFYWNPDVSLDHDNHAVLVSQYLADFFVNEARRSDHKYPNTVAESLAVIENYPVVYTKSLEGDPFDLCYFFNFTGEQ